MSGRYVEIEKTKKEDKKRKKEVGGGGYVDMHPADRTDTKGKPNAKPKSKSRTESEEKNKEKRKSPKEKESKKKDKDKKHPKSEDSAKQRSPKHKPSIVETSGRKSKNGRSDCRFPGPQKSRTQIRPEKKCGSRVQDYSVAGDRSQVQPAPKDGKSAPKKERQKLAMLMRRIFNRSQEAELFPRLFAAFLVWFFVFSFVFAFMWLQTDWL